MTEASDIDCHLNLFHFMMLKRLTVERTASTSLKVIPPSLTLLPIITLIFKGEGLFDILP